MGSMIEFLRPDGTTAPGYFAAAKKDARSRRRAVRGMVGLDDRIKETADRLATHGFNVVVPDLYRGRCAATGDEANHLMEGLDFGDAATQDAAGAASFLREQGAKRVGVMGFCMGGALALLAVMHGNEFDSASIWYGYPPAEAGDPAKSRFRCRGTGRYTTATSPSTASRRSNANSKRAVSGTSFTATTPSTASSIRANPAKAASGTITASTRRRPGNEPSSFSIAR